jgi:hypothetical protein
VGHQFLGSARVRSGGDRPPGEGGERAGAVHQRPRDVREPRRVDNLVVGPEVVTADRRARAAGEPPTMIPVIGDAPGHLVGLPTPESREWFTRARTQPNPSWPNEVTLRSMDLFYGYEPARYLPDVTPTPR